MPAQYLACGFGQSNLLGATAVSLAGVTYPATMQWKYRVGGVANPPTWVERGWTNLGLALGPDNVTNYVGPFIDMAQRLEEVEPGQWELIELALSSSGMEHWASATFPTLDPDGISLRQRYRTMITDAQTARGLTAKFALAVNGEADSANETQANLYKQRMIDFRDYLQQEVPDLRIIVARLNDSFSAPFSATVRTAQGELGAERDFIVVSTDDYAMAGDNIHYPLASHLAMGRNYADAWFASTAVGRRRGYSRSSFVAEFLP